MTEQNYSTIELELVAIVYDFRVEITIQVAAVCGPNIFQSSYAFENNDGKNAKLTIWDLYLQPFNFGSIIDHKSFTGMSTYNLEPSSGIKLKCQQPNSCSRNT